MIEVLSSADPEVFELCRAEERRQADKIRLIPSENYVSKAVLEASSSVFTNKYSEGYPGKRYYEGQEFVDPLEQLAIDRAKALFGAAARQRAALLGLAREPGRLPRLPEARRQGDGAGAADGRPPDARLERVDHRQVLHVGAVRRPQGHRPHRLRRGPRPGQEGAPRAAVGRRHRVLAHVGLRDHGVDRARGRRPLLRRHRPHRRADRGRRAPVAGAARRRGHDHHAQDAARPARRHDPVPRRTRAGHRPRGVPRPAGRPARAHHRGARGGAARGGRSRPSRITRSNVVSKRARARGGADGARLRRRLGRHRQPPDPDRPHQQERPGQDRGRARWTRRGSS